jgi:hypothetical protein
LEKVKGAFITPNPANVPNNPMNATIQAQSNATPPGFEQNYSQSLTV